MSPQTLTRRAVLLAVLLAVAATAGSSAPAPKSGIFEYEVQAGAPNQPAQKMAIKLWIKGQRSRQEMTTPMGKQVVIIGPEGTFMMRSGSKEAMKMKTMGAASASPFGEVAKLRQGKKVGSEKVGRYSTDIYEQNTEIKSPGMPQPIKVSTRSWVSAAVPVPVKQERTIAHDGHTIITLKSAQLNASVPDTMFQLPKSTKVRENPMGMAIPKGTPRRK